MATAKDIMTKEVITVTTDVTIEGLARIFTRHDISGAGVVDEDGKLIGIVTENDLIKMEQRLHIPTVINIFDAVIYLGSSKRFEEDIKRMAATRVEDIFRKDIVTITESSTIEEIATIMSEKNIHHLPVVKKGKLVGIVGKKDIVRAIAKIER
ncbi:MAG TPA: CBS domain-containing protein [Nitrospirota bacterium]|nr:CBS domain-containing protein [Nitrospirota bacterium]